MKTQSMTMEDIGCELQSIITLCGSMLEYAQSQEWDLLRQADIKRMGQLEKLFTAARLQDIESYPEYMERLADLDKEILELSKASLNKNAEEIRKLKALHLYEQASLS